MGFDLNRHWLEPSPWAHPTLYSTKNMLMELAQCGVSLQFVALLVYMRTCKYFA